MLSVHGVNNKKKNYASIFTVASIEQMEDFIWLHIRKTPIWYDWVKCIPKEQLFENKSRIHRYHFIRYIESELGLSFKKTLIPSEQTSNKSSEFIASSILA